MCQANIHQDSWGAESGPKDIVDSASALPIAGASLANMVASGLDVGVTLWFGYDNVFQARADAECGRGIDFGGVVLATTAVQDDPDGNVMAHRSMPARSQRCRPEALPIFGSAEQFIQDIAYTNGAIHGKASDVADPRCCCCRQELTRRVVNSTATPKRITHSASGVNHLAPEGKESCANFLARTRLNFSFLSMTVR